MFTRIHPTAIIYPGVVLGNHVKIGPYCIIGGPPESKEHYHTGGNPGVIIGDNTVITGHVTIDAGTITETKIGSDCFIMKGCHIGHDVELGDNSTFSPHVVIGGHCKIGSNAKFGMGAIVRNRKEVPKDVILGMGTIVTRTTELWSGGTFVGSPAKKLL